MTDVPVLLLVFNRPDKTRQVLDQLRQVRPTGLFVAADGPRPGRADDAARCAETRKLVDEIDWPCTVQTLFSESNLGCKRGVEAGISWFFSQVEAGIILEDDCVPAPDFFPFCAQLLERYRDADDVMMVSGTNLLGQWKPESQSYHFSHGYSIWGWATWRRAWAQYDPSLSAWREPAARATLREVLGEDQARALAAQLDGVTAGRIDTWDFPWTMTMALRRAVNAVPSRNLVTNIGFDSDATHTKNEWSQRAGLATHELTFPLRHPQSRAADRDFDRLVHQQGKPVYSRLADLLPPAVQQPVRAAFHKLTALVPR